MSKHKNIRLLYLFSFLNGFLLYSAILVIYFAKVTGSYALAMSIFSVAMVSSAVFEVPTGVYSDLVGRKKTITLGALSLLVAVILYAAAGGYWMLFCGAVFEGLSRAFFSGNNNAFLFDTLVSENKENYFEEHLGRIGSLEQLALGVSAILGSILASYSMPLVLWLTTVPVFAMVFVSLGLLEINKISETPENIYSHLREAIKEFKNNVKLRLLSLSTITGFAIGEASFQFRPVFVASLWPVWAIGLSSTISFFGASLSFYFSGRLVKKFKAIKILIFQNLFSRITGIFALLVPSIFSPLILTLTSFLYGPNQVSKETLLQKEFTDTQRATLSSLNSLAGSLLFGVVSFSLGLFADVLSPRMGLLALQFLNFITLFLYLQVFKKETVKN